MLFHLLNSTHLIKLKSTTKQTFYNFHHREIVYEIREDPYKHKDLANLLFS